MVLFARRICTIFLAVIFFSCQSNKKEIKMVEKKPFGTLANGEEGSLYTLTNKNGLTASITNYGAAVTSLFVPDKNGKLSDVVLGYDDLAGYVNCKSYFGVIVGRYGNRIGKGKFALDGEQYQVTVNDGENHLHGGARGFHKVLWRAEPGQTDSSQSLKLTYTSPDGDEGYPGTVTVDVTYTLTDNNELVIAYQGKTDRTTILNPTHHSYFNLTGAPAKTILDHQLQIESDSITPVGKGLITTGVITPVENTPMDFRTSTPIGLHINELNEQLALGLGYDHNWVLRNFDGKVRRAAELYDASSGRLMTVLTDQPGLQFYSGNFLDGSIKGKNNIVYNHRTGLCLAAQHHPDSPNKPRFPSVTLKPGEVYRQTTMYVFSTK